VVESLRVDSLANVHPRIAHKNHKLMYHDDSKQQPAGASFWDNQKLRRNPSFSLHMSSFNHHSNSICYRSGRTSRFSMRNNYNGKKCPSLRYVDRNARGLSMSSRSSETEVDKANATKNDTSIKSSAQTSQIITSTAQTSPENANSSKWQANNFENDYQLLKTAMARESAMTNLQQQQRKYTLDYGFARNRRPLIKDLLQTIVKIGAWMLFLIGGNAGIGIGSAIEAWNVQQSWRRKLHIIGAHAAVTLSTAHHWIVGVTIPLLLLTLMKRGKLIPSGRALDEYFTSRKQSTAPVFFYTTEKSKKRAKDKDVGDYALCLLENWSSAVIGALGLGMYSLILSLRKHVSSNTSHVGGPISSISVCARLLTRLGAAAAVYQFPSLLFELQRGDQPRPLCRSTTYMQQAVKAMLRWLPLGVASDLAVLIGTQKGGLGKAGPGIVVVSILSVVAPLCHLVALARIARLSKCSAVSLSEATSFPAGHGNQIERDEDQQVKWRYQLRWRTPQRIGESIRTWSNYFFTGHIPLLFEMDDWKKQPLQYDDLSTEGTQYLFSKSRKSPGKEDTTTDNQSDNDDLISRVDAITESLSLIFRDRDAAIQNATQARLIKHQESYDTKTLEDVLGVAVQQTFDIGVSYEFDHFNPPADGKEVSIHQLRARMAKSAVRRKKKLDGGMEKELDLLRRLNENVVTDKNREIAEKETKSVEEDIRERHSKEVDRMTNALFTLIPTNAEAPKGTERYESPIMVAEYVDLKAPFERKGELKATLGSAPDPLSMMEDSIRREYGDEAADDYRREEIAARIKEKEMLSTFRQRYGELEDDETLQPESTSADIGDVDDSSDTAGGVA